jgi:hypothetical protein
MISFAFVLTILTFSYNLYKNRKVKTIILRPGITEAEYNREKNRVEKIHKED